MTQVRLIATELLASQIRSTLRISKQPSSNVDRHVELTERNSSKPQHAPQSNRSQHVSQPSHEAAYLAALQRTHTQLLPPTSTSSLRCARLLQPGLLQALLSGMRPATA
jgi:hypothetical protein